MKSSKYSCLFLKRRLRAAALKAIIWLIYHFSLFHLQMPSRWSGIPKIILLTNASSVVNVTYVADTVFLYLFWTNRDVQRIVLKIKMIVWQVRTCICAGIGEGRECGFKEMRDQDYFSLLWWNLKKKKIFRCVINCFTRIRENKIIYIPGGQ